MLPKRLIAGLGRARAVAFALLFSLAPSAMGNSGDALAERWRGAGVAAILPSYEWARAALVERSATGSTPWSQAMLHRLGRSEALELRFRGAAQSLSFASRGRDIGGFDRTPALHAAQRGPFAGGWFGSSMVLGLGGRGELEAEAILVYQRFAAGDLGRIASSGPLLAEPSVPGVDRGVTESVFGRGVRFEYRYALDGLSELALEAQSRVDMEPFKSFRGVYSDSGDFDIPAVLGVGLRSELAPGLELSARMQRVFFSEVRPFTSASLPVRLLALLGDASAPRFAWDDLDLYSAQLRWTPTLGDGLVLGVSSRQVPLPSAPILRDALAASAPSYHVSLGYERDLGALGVVSARVAYAPRQGFLALGPFQPRSEHATEQRQREFDLAWVVGF